MSASEQFNAQQTINAFNERKNANLDYFREAFPSIYECFAQYATQETKLTASMDGQANLQTSKGLLYQGSAQVVGASEAEEFASVFKPGTLFQSINPPMQDNYCFSRFFHQIMNGVIQQSPIIGEPLRDQYDVPERYPLLVFLGCGLGYQIEATLESRAAQHVIIFETNLEHFYLSLYTVDWRSVCQPYQTDPARTIQFLVSGTEDFEHNWKLLWNELISYYPYFPVATFFFNHLGRDRFDAITSKINEGIPVVVYGWGHFDDELNQLNNAIHNLKLDIPMLPNQVRADHLDAPVFIVGSGPSLDKKLAFLKAQRDKIVIVSCGSGITALYTAGITPDIHVVLESDYVQLDSLKPVDDKAYLSRIVAIGSLQMSPHIVEMGFKSCLAFTKTEGAVAKLYDDMPSPLRFSGPTCTNAGVSLMASLGFTQLYLVGMDFGFRDKADHHAKGSVYYNADQSELLESMAQIKDNELLQLRSVFGDMIWSRPYYYTSKARLETCIDHFKGTTTCWNCSEGADIQGASWLNSERLLVQALAWPAIDKDALCDELVGRGLTLSELMSQSIEERIRVLAREIEAFNNGIAQVIRDRQSEQRDIMDIASAVRNHVERSKSDYSAMVYQLISGSIQHFLYMGLTHYLAMGRRFDPAQRQQFTQQWAQGMLTFLDGSVMEYKRILYKEYDIKKDKLLNVSITEAVDE